MKLVNTLLILSLSLFLTSCSEDESFRLSNVEGGLSTATTDEGGTEGEGEADKKKKCEEKKAHKKCEGYVLGEERDDNPKYKMTQLNYDVTKLEDYKCEDGKVVFCHVPPGNAKAAHYIKIDSNDEAIASHLDKIADDGVNSIYSYLLRCDKYSDKKKKKGGFFSKLFGKKKHHESDDEEDEECEYEKEEHEYKEHHKKEHYDEEDDD